jgi:hypothetical protein
MVTDPPSGIAFMGKAWDRDKGGRDQWIAWLAEIMREALRVLKPGAHALVWAIPRTSHWTATALEDAGFEIRDVVTHHFGSGFPKSLDVSKAIDGGGWSPSSPGISSKIKEARTRMGLSLADVGEAVLSSTGGRFGSWYHRGGHMFFETGRALPSTTEEMLAVCEAVGLGSDLLTIFDESEREVIGKLGCGPGFGDHRFGEGGDLTAPSTDAAKQWQGFGTALKPATEHWILARKPMSGTVAANVLAHGCGGLNVDGCRVAHNEECKLMAAQTDKVAMTGGGKVAQGGRHKPVLELKPEGRWPANLVLSHATCCTDDRCGECCPVAELDRQSGERPVSGSAKTGKPRTTKSANQIYGPGIGPGRLHNDTGGASRFFYCAKPSTGEREAGLDGEKKTAKDGSDGLKSPRAGAGRTSSGRANSHPTVKPIDLMRWLVRLVTPPGGTVLDPFMGSGTTGIAADREGFSFIGIEREQEYLEIAKGRIEGDCPLFTKAVVK